MISPRHNGPPILTEQSMRIGLTYLAHRDPGLAQILDELGSPPMWARDPGFPTLVHIILEQQVSLASARAAFDRLLAVCEVISPDCFLALSPLELRRIGFSRQKGAYCRQLAQMLQAGELDLTVLHELDDDAVRRELVRIRGIGPWTAEIYLLMALLRPDSWPSGDLALAVAVKQVKGLTQRPSPSELKAIGEPWRPWRAVAARLLWHRYLCDRA